MAKRVTITITVDVPDYRTPDSLASDLEDALLDDVQEAMTEMLEAAKAEDFSDLDDMPVCRVKVTRSVPTPVARS